MKITSHYPSLEGLHASKRKIYPEALRNYFEGTPLSHPFTTYNSGTALKLLLLRKFVFVQNLLDINRLPLTEFAHLIRFSCIVHRHPL